MTEISDKPAKLPETVERFIGVLHETAERLAGLKDVTVVSFDDVASGKTPLN
jgi:hypothetical protein